MKANTEQYFLRCYTATVLFRQHLYLAEENWYLWFTSWTALQRTMPFFHVSTNVLLTVCTIWAVVSPCQIPGEGDLSKINFGNNGHLTRALTILHKIPHYHQRPPEELIEYNLDLFVANIACNKLIKTKLMILNITSTGSLNLSKNRYQKWL